MSVSTNPIAMAVHGGAWDIPPDEQDDHRSGCDVALAVGLAVLRDGGTSLDAVEAAVSRMEASGIFNAGLGSCLDELGMASLDAGVMSGRDLRCGSVCAVRHISNPIRLARRVLESPVVMLVADGAENFAERAGIELCSTTALVHPRELERWRSSANASSGPGSPRMNGGTVGAVALDRDGDVAAATSTGGRVRKPVGRVGDSPLVGAGVFADNLSAAVSATGDGEALIPLVWSKACADLVGQGRPASKAATEALDLLVRTNARAGVILVDRTGDVGVAYTTATMAFAYQAADGSSGSGPAT